MNSYLAKFCFSREIISWLEKIGRGQAVHVLTCVTEIFKFAEKNEDFFQGCGLYVVGSSLKGNFSDVDIVIVGLDFRAVVLYDKIFLMDPETLIYEEILVEPQLFLIMKEDQNGEPTVLKPVTEVKEPDFFTSLEAYSRMGLEYKGTRYDYNIAKYSCHSLDLEGFCSHHADSSYLIKEMRDLFCTAGNNISLSDPFDNYGFGGMQSFLVYRIPVTMRNNLPGVEHTTIDDVKPIDFCIHAENLHREEWKRHQASLGLPYLALKEWPRTDQNRMIITKHDYPRFIDPNGVKRAKVDSMFFSSYRPDEVTDVIDI